ncbi:hypothetical protein [Pseudooceanicola sp.]|uniref:hypothetical protein n=1 Tax=Pseudooceanicola sp. TaxID=1914328 RepID=UPI0035158C65
MASTTTLSGNYGYTAYRYSGDASVIDASDASWIVANTGSNINLYPFLVNNASDGIEVFGITINGQVSQTLDWANAYINSAAVMVRDTADSILHDITITNPWDALRVAGGSNGFEIYNVHVTGARDDAIENDDGASGVIRDSLFDGVFSGISLGNKYTPNRTNQVVEIDNVLLRMESYLYRGDVTHGSPFKMVENSPKLKITDSVIAIEDPDHIGDWRLDLAWDKTIESSGNVFLNLSDKALPSDYPMPGAGWTVLQGQAARDYWAKARAEWIAEQDGSTAPVAEVPQGSTSNSDTPQVVDEADDVLLPAPLPGPGLEVSIKTVPDFNHNTDKIVLDSSIFTSLTAPNAAGYRTLDQTFFEIARQAGDSNDYIMYKWKTGELFYDADGTGAGAQVKIAQLEERLSLDHTHFVVSDGTGVPAVSVLPGPVDESTVEATRNTAASTSPDALTIDTIPASGHHLDLIGDFEPGTNKILLDHDVFKSLTDSNGGSSGELDVSQFKIAERAGDADDHIMYKWKTGELFYDADGAGGQAQVLIAELDLRMSLDHSDFLIV